MTGNAGPGDGSRSVVTPHLPDPRRGSALVVVLVFAALLAGLIGVALQGVSSGARAAAGFLDEVRADDLGRGAADAVAAAILAGGPPARRGGAFSVRVEGAEMEVEYRSESARVDLNRAPADLVAAVLAAAGAEPALMASVRGRIARERGDRDAPPAVRPLDPVQSSFGATSGRGAGTPDPTSRPAAAPPFETPLDAVARWDLPPAVAARALPAFTVANGTPKVDPVLADRLVLSALMGGEEARVDDFVARRDEGFVDAQSALLLLPVTSQAFAGFADVSAVRATALVTVAHRFKRRYEVVLDPPAFPGQAPNVLSWRPLF